MKLELNVEEVLQAAQSYYLGAELLAARFNIHILATFDL